MSAALVYIGEASVGRLEYLGDDGSSFRDDHKFTFDEEWLTDARRPVLGQFFEDRMPRPVFSSGLPAWFAHLLPPDPLRRNIIRWVGFPSDVDLLDLLIRLGDDLPGAVRLVPVEPQSGVRISRKFASNSIISFSLPGAQWKMSLRPGDKGLTIPLRGEVGEVIGKFSNPRYPRLPFVEYATTCWAQRANVITHKTRLAESSELYDLPRDLPMVNDRWLLVERFDRSEKNGRVHVEDFAQIRGSSPDNLYDYSYEHLAMLVKILCPDADRVELARRMTFMVVCGNGDAHWKNWGVIYTDGRTPQLSPAYDIVSTVIYKSTDNLALTLGGSKAFEDAKPARWDGLAHALDMDHAELARHAREARERAESVWSQDRHALGFNAREVAMIERHLLRLPSWGL